MHQVVDLLTPLRANGGGRLTRLDVRVQLALALTTILAVAFRSAGLAAGAGRFRQSRGAGRAAGAAAKRAGRLVGPMGLAVVILALRAFTTGRTPWLFAPPRRLAAGRDPRRARRRSLRSACGCWPQWAWRWC